MISINSEIGTRRFVNPLSILYGEFRPISDNDNPSELNRQTLQGQNIQFSFNKESDGVTVLNVVSQQLELSFNKVKKDFYGWPIYLSETSAQDIWTSLRILKNNLEIGLWSKDDGKLSCLSLREIPLRAEYGNTRPSSPPSPSPSPSPPPSNRNRIIDFA